MSATVSRSVPCPTCRNPAVYGPGNPWRPFCSQRCRSIDLGAWASERFRVCAENPPDGPDGLNGQNSPGDRNAAGGTLGRTSGGTPAPAH